MARAAPVPSACAFVSSRRSLNGDRAVTQAASGLLLGRPEADATAVASPRAQQPVRGRRQGVDRARLCPGMRQPGRIQGIARRGLVARPGVAAGRWRHQGARDRQNGSNARAHPGPERTRRRPVWHCFRATARALRPPASHTGDTSSRPPPGPQPAETTARPGRVHAGRRGGNAAGAATASSVSVVDRGWVRTEERICHPPCLRTEKPLSGSSGLVTQGGSPGSLSEPGKPRLSRPPWGLRRRPSLKSRVPAAGLCNARQSGENPARGRWRDSGIGVHGSVPVPKRMRVPGRSRTRGGCPWTPRRSSLSPLVSANSAAGAARWSP